MGAPAHPADDMGLLARHLANAKLPASKITAMVNAEDHIVQAVGTLLKRPNGITQNDLDDAFRRAKRGGKFANQIVDQFARALPPVSNQNALRKALMQQRERSVRTLVVLHMEAQKRGIRVAAVQDPALRSAVQ